MPNMKQWMLVVESETADEVRAVLEGMGYCVKLATDPKLCLLPLLDLIAPAPAITQSAREAAPEKAPIAC